MTTTRTLYVRNVPDRLLREARALAARRGTTLGSLVIEALQEKTSGTAAPSGLAEDMAWYAAHRADLEARYVGEHVAIAAGRVLDHDPDYDALARRVFAQGVRSVFMPLVQHGERTVDLRGPRRG